MDNSSYGNWVFAAGATSDGGKFVFVWDAPGDSSQGLTKYIDLEYSTEADYVWLLLAIENIATVEIAPVPVPLSAAFLPVGLGAFAMLRKRRRRVS